MSFSDWDFHERVTEATIPSSIQVFVDDFTPPAPLVGIGSLRIEDTGAPAVATVAGTLLQDEFNTTLDSGRMRSVFRRQNGLGFRDTGIYFLTSGYNPTLDNVTGYAVYFIDGGPTIRLVKFTNGLHDNSNFTILGSFSSIFGGSDENVVMEVEWRGGVIARFTGGTEIFVRFATGTDFNNLVQLGTVTDTSSFYYVGFNGLWVRSRNEVEPLDTLLDDTGVWNREFV